MNALKVAERVMGENMSREVLRGASDIAAVVQGISNEQEVQAMSKAPENSMKSAMTPEQSFFSVFCIEALADELGLTGDKVYKLLTEDSDILDSYIVPHYDALHTQGRDYIIRELTDMMRGQGVLR